MHRVLSFYGCSGLTSVTIPDSITSIGNFAFSGCDGLTLFQVAPGNPSYKAIDGVLCTKAGKKLVCFPSGKSESYTFPDSVTSIGASAFCNCSGLMSVEIGNAVVSIEDTAFAGCQGLTNVTIGNSVTSIGAHAFGGCSSLTGLTIPGSVASIGEGAFASCSGLTSVTIGNNVSIIENSAFFGCSNLTRVTISDSVTSIGADAFSGCASALYDMNAIPGVFLVDGWAIGNSGALKGALDLTGIRGIANRAFAECKGLTSVTIGHGLVSIGDEAFYNCYGLASVELPDGVTSIGWGAFSGCAVALSDTNAIPGVYLVDGWAVGNSGRLAGVLDLTGIRGIASGAFSMCGRLTSVTIPASVRHIGEGAFFWCSGLTSVTIGRGLVSIGDEAFAQCRGLTSVALPDSVMSIGSNTFSNCSGLATLYAPESWKSKHVGWHFWSSYAGVPEGCEIIYYALPKTSTGVPYAWLEKHGLGDGTAEGYEAAAATNAANRANTVADCYVAGLDPTDPAARFTAEIAFTNGSPVVSWKPDLNEKDTKSERSYVLEGTPTLTNTWGPTNAASRFFRVKVALPKP